MRLFVGIWPPEPVVRDLAALQAELVRRAPKGSLRPTPKAQIHLTLRFLGEVADDQMEALMANLRAAARGSRRAWLSASGWGAFPSRQQARVVWIGVRGEVDAAMELQRRVETVTAAFGQAPERRVFHPHFTLARVRDGGSRERRALAEALDHLPSPAESTWETAGLRLVRSELASSGARYVTQAEIPLPQNS